MKIRMWMTVMALFFIMTGCVEKRKQEKAIIYIGTYTGKTSEGIYVYKMDMNTGALERLHVIGNIENPSFLTIDSRNEFLYSVHELNNYQGQRTGAIRSFKIDPDTWNLTLLSEQPSFGEHPCHVTVTETGDYVFLANYTSGSVSMFPVQDGMIAVMSDTAQHVGFGPNKNRQQSPHAHSVNLSPDGCFLYVMDLGIDKIMIYDVYSTPGQLTPADPPFVNTAPGAGPRHFTFHPNGKIAYVINELNSTITSYMYAAENGLLTEIETVQTLPADFDGQNTTADIHITPDGRFLYGSNRGHDSLVIFKIDAQTGKLALVGHQSVLGQTPRNFAIDPTGAFLLVANQNSDNIVVFSINKATGELQDTGHRAEVSLPVCIKMVSPN